MDKCRNPCEYISYLLHYNSERMLHDKKQASNPNFINYQMPKLAVFYFQMLKKGLLSNYNKEHHVGARSIFLHIQLP